MPPDEPPTIITKLTLRISAYVLGAIVLLVLALAFVLKDPSAAVVGWTDWLLKLAGAVVAILGILDAVASYSWAKVEEQATNKKIAATNERIADTKAKEQRVNQVLAAVQAKHAGLSDDDVERVLEAS